MSVVRVLLFLVAALAVAILAGQNPVPLHVAFLSWQATTALSVIVILSAVLGAICVAILSTASQWHWRNRSRRLEAELRNRPVVAVQAPTVRSEPIAAEVPSSPVKRIVRQPRS